MSTIQQLKNFIRHGKQARAAAPEEAPRKTEQQQAPTVQHKTASDPSNTHYARAQEPGNEYGDDDYARSKSKKRVDDEKLAKLIAEENASKSKFPRYPGLERWELVDKMGDGAFSNVYRARDTTGQQGEVAIKVVRKYEMNSMQGNKHLHPDFKKVPKAAERSNILKEVQIMRQLDHPNIIKLVEFSESRQYYYIILELAPGGELFHQIVRLTYFSEELSRHVIVQVAKALEYLHEEKGVVHRDIKPENILFEPIPMVPSKHPKPKQPGDEDKVDEGEFIPGQGAGGIGRIKIADFGLSKIVWDNQTMTPCGTVGYTAPEIVKDERYSKSVDMWALGCVLYTLLCGFPPFYDESIEVLTEKVAKGQYTFLSPWWDEISKSAQDLISHLLTVDPEKRFTITEFLAHPWIAGNGPTPRDEMKKADGMLRAFDATKFEESGKRYDFRSPGAVNLREVFDVGYAVHRQEEEGKRRAQIGPKGTPARFLGGLNEEDEDDDVMQIDGQDNTAAKPNAATQALEQSMRKANIRDQEQQQQSRGRERERAERGYGQHSATVAAAARQQVRERNRQRGAFELNLDNATLLGKRNKKVPVMGV
ncbi:CAMK/CAMK1/CAMK1-RCK protein kinase [Fusarium oxysporum f. sp. raphani 54005]|uniref:Related to serine/threonine-protein kinase n=11 Tax=Fusarium oxysporum TaxID=5507 RepID=A0A2H3SRB5_FUSOX|nr:kinase-like domain-containing protein [Fusarium oxysporum Fo47]EWZ86913.1 CAMK/CAMK1/CAMK1-RCK protein kinase [Fusarium oxysporum f. sp. lycopersici MN25]EXA51714.1 CAMK/CAMK1/CAMK1-RCK protein kinase [Fusarium oxysporum f. sp. pisi HDV247]EXK96384.1 CAMK/CAMK1/CAMK1-RCK protein kinase [Fusarium oxysporum f. sp. raphani 54005]EXL44081.1 CAMK/CAMK1/CAMK1-RCK protein kinase [Fusarium oxysporum f. sp. radicis-lycopersici 26381]EXL82355.1 CAMK/CAMK1/CAMK1-RCK protein kinase [Fusarium oxysporum 